MVTHTDLDSFLTDPLHLLHIPYWSLYFVWVRAKAIRILHRIVAFLFYATLLCYLSLPAPSPREPPDKDTSTLASWALFTHTARCCALGGDLTTSEQAHTFSLYESWRNPNILFEPPEPSFCGYPAALGLALFSSTTMVSISILMWFYNFHLKCGGTNWINWTIKTCKRVFPTSFADIRLKDSYNGPPIATPPKLMIAAARATSPKMVRHKAKLLAALTMLGTVAGQRETFLLQSDVQLRQNLRKYRLPNTGALGTNRLNPKVRRALLQQMQDQDDIFQEISKNEPNTYSTIIDTGASASCVNDRNILVPGSLRRLQKPIKLDGIAGGQMVEYTGRVELETLDANGNLFSIQTKVMLNENLPCILISPQSVLKEAVDQHNGNKQDHFSVYHDRGEWIAGDNCALTVNYDSSFLPRVTFFTKGHAESSLTAFYNVLHDSNKNLTPLQKVWLRWHTKLGHLSFAHVQKLAGANYLDTHALALSDLPKSAWPHCEACRYGKQVRTPDKTTITTKNPEAVGRLTEGRLTPGQTIFCDQLESRLRGRLLHTAGREADRDKFCGSTVFCDAASGYIHVEHQVTLNATDTINAKTSFERQAMEMGVTIDSYHTDNGIFKSQAFTRELHEKYQSIRFSGVGAKWQNGVAENCIRIVVTKARTMMIHASLMWPDVKDEALWPLAVSHAVYLYNHTPNEQSGISPIDYFTRTMTTCPALQNAHP